MTLNPRAALLAASFVCVASEAAAQLVMNQPVGIVALLPTSPATVLATVGPGLFRSTHTNFQLLAGEFQTIYMRQPGAPQPLINRIVFDPANPQIVYAAVDAADGGVWKSTDAGATWAPSGNGLPATGGAAIGLQLEPRQSIILYCVIDKEIFRSPDSGGNWTKVSTLPGAASQFVISPHDTNLWVAAENNQIRRSLDGGQTWLIGATLGLGTGTITTSMVFDVNNPNLVYVSAAGIGRGFGVYQVDVASSPSTSNLRHSAQVFRLFYPSPNSTVLLASSLGNGDASCIDIPLDSGLTRWGRSCIPNSLGPPFLALNPTNLAQAFAGTSSGLFKSTSGLGPWNSAFGSVRPTLAAPARPYEFTLEPGRSASLNLNLRLLESQAWSVPLDVTTAGGAWLTTTNVTGSTPASAFVRVSSAGLSPGTYEGAVTVRSILATNSPLTIPVKLTVTAAGADPGYTIQTIAGTGAPADTGSDGPANRATLSSPDSLALDTDGALYLVDSGNHSVKAVRPDGRLQRVAGTGRPGFSGDGGDPLLATLLGPRGLAIVPGGFYVTDAGNRRVRRTLGSTISTYLSGPENMRGIAVSPSGAVYLALATDHVVIAVEGDVTQARVVAGRIGVSGFRGEGTPATAALLSSPSEVYLDANGDLYIADTDNHRIRVISAADKTIRTVAGSGLGGFQSESGSALNVALNRPTGVAVDAAGNVYIADSGNNRIRMVTPDGQIRTIAGTGEAGFAGEGTPAIQAQLRGPSDVAAAPDGRVYFSDTQNHRIRLLTPRSTGSPVISEGGIVNAASFTAALSQGGLFSVFGTNLAPGTASASAVPWPQTLSNVQVLFNGQPAPLNFVSSGQVNGQTPYGLSGGDVEIAVVVDGVASPPRRVTLQEATPGIFQYGINRAIVQNADGSLNAANNPARAGEAITVYLTGIGPLDNPVATGDTAPVDPLSRATAGVRVTVGGVEAQVLYLGLTPGFVGLAQANIFVPQLGAGEYPLEITVGGTASNRPVITVRN